MEIETRGEQEGRRVGGGERAAVAWSSEEVAHAARMSEATARGVVRTTASTSTIVASST